eukprot:GAHX01000484.1.p1 GENE.GAHX01000484.1~~GAHX01000484.1.p1  ORF type:complete len:339 (-),score=28.68 GAHX01000484.1:46-1062(-)
MNKHIDGLGISIQSFVQISYSTEQSTICAEIKFIYRGVSWTRCRTEYQIDCFLHQLCVTFSTRGDPAASIYLPSEEESFSHILIPKPQKPDTKNSPTSSWQRLSNINKKIRDWGCMFFVQTKILQEFYLSEFIDPPRELYDAMRNQFVGLSENVENLNLPFPKNESERKFIGFVKNVNSTSKNIDVVVQGFLKSVLPITQAIRVEILTTFLFGYTTSVGSGNGLLGLLKGSSPYRTEALEILAKLLNYVNNANVLDVCNILYLSDLSDVGISLDDFYYSGVPSAIKNVNSICYMLWLESKSQFNFKLLFDKEENYNNAHTVIRRRTSLNNNMFSFTLD